MAEDSEYEIEVINGTEDNAYQGLSKTYFTSAGGQMYLFHKPENTPIVGQILVGSVMRDKRGSMKFTKRKLEPFPSTARPMMDTVTKNAPTVAPAAPERTYKADPLKLKQELTLEQARNMSIQRQVGLKATIDLIVAGHRDYSQLIDTYCDMMEILSEPDWRELKRFEAKDTLPTEAQIDKGLEDDVWDEKPE